MPIFLFLYPKSASLRQLGGTCTCSVDVRSWIKPAWPILTANMQRLQLRKEKEGGREAEEDIGWEGKQRGRERERGRGRERAGESRGERECEEEKKERREGRGE